MEFQGGDINIRKWLRHNILTWFRHNKREFPWRQTDDPYQIYVAEVMLRQTFADKVVPVYNTFIEKYPNVNILSKADPDEVRELIYPLGLLYRADQLVEFANKLVSKHNGKFPKSRERLEELPGIGPYTSSAILCFAFGKTEAIIDTNVLRIYRRFFGIGEHSTQRGPDKETIETARDIVPTKNSGKFNLALLDFAALVCTHYSPKCGNCPIAEKCVYNNRGNDAY